jgi:hypothetical protein
MSVPGLMEVLSWNKPGGAEENNENPRDSRFLGQDWNQAHPQYF